MSAGEIILFLLNSILLGVGLAMDAFSASLANGIAQPKMSVRRMCLIAGVFAGFQIAMPLIGWGCVRTVAQLFTSFQKLIPWIALLLLAYIGGKMVLEGIRTRKENREAPESSEASSDTEAKTVKQGKSGEQGFQDGAVLKTGELILQGIATSIDALSVGFTISSYRAPQALAESLVIGVVTFVICMAGVCIGRKFGTKLAGKATILGGVILIAIGLEIFLTGGVFS